MDLEGIISGINDLSEPACMDGILIYLEQLQAEDEEFMMVCCGVI